MNCIICGKGEGLTRTVFQYENENFESVSICSKCESEFKKTVQEKLSIKLKDIIVTTGFSVEGKQIKEYRGIVSSEIITGLGFISDVFADFRDFFGGRVKSYQKNLSEIKEVGIYEIKLEALRKGANAIIGVDLDYGDLKGTMFMLVINGTAVVVE